MLGGWLREAVRASGARRFFARKPRRRRRAYVRAFVESLENRTLLDGSGIVNSAPVWDPATYTFAVEENTVDNVIGQLHVTDPDGDMLSVAVYDGEDYVGQFWVDQYDHTLRGPTDEPLDFERKAQYVLTVDASDGLELVSATVVINVIDQDDVPHVQQESYTFDVSEAAEVGTVIGRIVATDPLGGGLYYGFYDGDYGPFSINSLTGEISIEEPLAGGDVYEFSVDVSNMIELVNVPVTINVLPLEDRPIFDTSTYYFDVDSPNGQVGTVHAESPRGYVTYFIITSDVPFMVNEQGEIFTTQDLEPGQTYTFELGAEDGYYCTTTDVTVEANFELM